MIAVTENLSNYNEIRDRKHELFTPEKRSHCIYCYAKLSRKYNDNTLLYSVGKTHTSAQPSQKNHISVTVSKRDQNECLKQ